MTCLMAESVWALRASGQVVCKGQLGIRGQAARLLAGANFAFWSKWRDLLTAVNQCWAANVPAAGAGLLCVGEPEALGGGSLALGAHLELTG